MTTPPLDPRELTQAEIDAHRYEMSEAFDGGLISRVEYDGQMRLMDEAELAVGQRTSKARRRNLCQQS